MEALFPIIRSFHYSSKVTDDQSLIAKVAEGDRDALATLYERYVRRLYNYVYYRTHHRETAEDIVSEVFLRALEHISSFDSTRGNVSAWFHGIARNLIVDHFRSLKPLQAIEDVWDLSSDTNVPRDADTALQVEKVREALKKLTPEQREMMILRLWDGYPFAEIAALTGKSEAACKMAFGRALKKIRSDLLLLLILPSLLHL